MLLNRRQQLPARPHIRRAFLGEIFATRGFTPANAISNACRQKNALAGHHWIGWWKRFLAESQARQIGSQGEFAGRMV